MFSGAPKLSRKIEKKDSYDFEKWRQKTLNYVGDEHVYKLVQVVLEMRKQGFCDDDLANQAIQSAFMPFHL